MCVCLDCLLGCLQVLGQPVSKGLGLKTSAFGKAKVCLRTLPLAWVGQQTGAAAPVVGTFPGLALAQGRGEQCVERQVSWERIDDKQRCRPVWETGHTCTYINTDTHAHRHRLIQ